MLKLRTLASLFFFAFLAHLAAFSQDYPFEVDQYPFVHYDKNYFEFPGDSSAFIRLYGAFDDLIMRGEGQVNIIHIGGSHIQADMLTGRLRERLQMFFPGLKGGRGFVFPYRLARTNNPRTYRVYYSGSWSSCRNVELRKTCTLGLSGISVSTSEADASISIVPANDWYVDYDFNKVKVFHSMDSASFDVRLIAGDTIAPAFTNNQLGYSLFLLDEYTDSLHLILEQTSESQNHFELYGANLETDDAGVYYHAIGVNGASIPSYLRCQMFVENMAALQPDMVVLTLGTNDAYTSNFDAEEYKQNFDSLLNAIHAAAPEAAILMTVPNDSYLYRRYANPNTAVCGQKIRELAKEHGAGVWDFYTVMGGLNSVSLWREANLAQGDRIHFTRYGYELQADLLFNAFLHAYDNYLEKKRRFTFNKAQ